MKILNYFLYYSSTKRLEAEGICTEEKLPSVSSINRIVRSNKRYDHNSGGNSSTNSNSSASSACKEEEASIPSIHHHNQHQQQQSNIMQNKSFKPIKTNKLGKFNNNQLNEDDLMNTTGTTDNGLHNRSSSSVDYEENYDNNETGYFNSNNNNNNNDDDDWDGDSDSDGEEEGEAE